MKLSGGILAACLAVCCTWEASVWAGTRVGNGGGGWLCRNRSDASPRWLELVDLFEAEVEFGLKLPEVRGNEWETLDTKIAFIQQHIPRLAGLLSVDAAYLRKALRVLPDGATLTRIEDGQIRVRPSPASCENGYLYYTQMANFTFDDRLLVNGEMWNLEIFSNKGRGGLLVHELVYKTLRDRFDDESSSRARAIVGLLFSDLKIEEVRSRVDRVLDTAPTDMEALRW